MESLDQLAVTVHQTAQLSDAEKRAFDEVKSRADNGEYDVTGKTIRQLITDQQAFDTDQRAQEERAAKLASDLRAQHEEQVRALRTAVTVVLLDKGFRDADTDNF
jgi:tellurite resistance protein